MNMQQHGGMVASCGPLTLCHCSAKATVLQQLIDSPNRQSLGINWQKQRAGRYNRRRASQTPELQWIASGGLDNMYGTVIQLLQ